MAARLLNRNKWIPGGYRFYQPELNWKAPRNISFDKLVQAVIHARKGNPAQCAKHHWSLDYNTVALEVDIFNANVCQAHGWLEYIQQSSVPTIPKQLPPNHRQVLASLKSAAATAKQLVAGAKTLIEWLDSGEAPVAPELSEHRAIVCAACPKNVKGDFTSWFTKPASELIKLQIERAQSLKLTTPRDAELNLCDVCKCPLKLKVHTPIAWILKRIAPEVIQKLMQVPNCWIPGEQQRGCCGKTEGQ